MTSETQTAEAPARARQPIAEPPRRKKKWKRLLWIPALGALAVAGWQWNPLAGPAAPAYATVTIRRGDLAKTISATGQVQALITVQVGTQISGIVSEIHADFNDQVRAGDLIARLEPSQIEAQLLQAKATLASAQARMNAARSTRLSQLSAVEASKANVENAAAALVEAERNHSTLQKLSGVGAIPRRDLETAEANRNQARAQKAQAEAQYEQTRAQGEVADSSIEQAIADVAQAKAAVDFAKVTLERTYVRSPIDGVVVSRSVDVGQTVASSLQAPVLFLIAKDLTKMQVLANIDEADVGQLKPGATVHFTVDAFPQDTFAGTVSQIRLAPTVVQNVVTYTAVIEVANPKLKLKPGMTATLTAAVEHRENVLLAPNSALRFRPDDAPPTEGPTLWQVEDNQLKPVKVRFGMTDGVSTEIITTELGEGDQIAAGAQQPARKNASSPFSGQTGGKRTGRF